MSKSNVMRNKILVVFANGDSKVYKNRSDVYKDLGVGWADMQKLLATGKAYSPKYPRRRELVGMTMDYAIEQN